MKKITVIGSSNIDLIMKLDKLPSRGETVTGGEFVQTFGGKGANQAVGAARAGGVVNFISCVGDDPYGQQCIENFKEDGIDISHVFIEKNMATGTALIMIGGDGDNMISVASGANYRMTSTHIDQAIEAIRGSEFVVLQYEIPKDTLYYIIDKCAEEGVKVIFNLAPADEFDQEHIAKLHTLVVNEVEAEYLSGIKVNDDESIIKAAKKLHDMGPENVIITLGSEGSFIQSETYSERVSAYKVDAIDATAAGDVYCGTLAAAMVEDKPLHEAVAFASAASAVSVTRMGAQPSAPTRDEIEELINSH